MSTSREEKVTQMVMKWINEFSLPLDDDAARESMSAVFSPSIRWRDHAFHVERTGIDAILGLRKAFNHCNQPFETQVKKFYHTPTGAVVETVWVGNCKNDIVRPDGQLAVKANGRDFKAHVCFVVEVDPEAGITMIDEYYNKPWWDGVPEEEYQKIQGASMKS